MEWGNLAKDILRIRGRVGQEVRAQSQAFLHILYPCFPSQADEETDLSVCEVSENLHENWY